MKTCAFTDCRRDVEKAGLCAGHRKQKTRHQPLRAVSERHYGSDRERNDARVQRAYDRLHTACGDERRRALRNLRDALLWRSRGVAKTGNRRLPPQ